MNTTGWSPEALARSICSPTYGGAVEMDIVSSYRLTVACASGVGLFDRRAGALGHEAQRVGCDRSVLETDQGPRRDCLPGCGGRRVRTAGRSGWALCRPHDRGGLRRDVGAECLMEHVLLDVDV